MKYLNKNLIVISIILFTLSITGCATNPRSLVLPQSLDKMEKIAPKIESLTSEEKQLLMSYFARIHMLNALGGNDINEKLTIGEAIEKERKYLNSNKRNSFIDNNIDLAIDNAKIGAVKANLSAACSIVTTKLAVDELKNTEAILSTIKELNNYDGEKSYSPFNENLSAYGIEPAPGVVTLEAGNNNTVIVKAWGKNTELIIEKHVDPPSLENND